MNERRQIFESPAVSVSRVGTTLHAKCRDCVFEEGISSGQPGSAMQHVAKTGHVVDEEDTIRRVIRPAEPEGMH